jgi:hypothetical protein
VIALKSSKGDGWVAFEDLRKVVGGQATVISLGWNTYTSFVKKAVEHQLLEQRSLGKQMKYVRLLPLRMWEDHIKLLTAPSLILEMCPTGHGGPRPILAAILQLTGGDIEAKVTLAELINVFSKTAEEVETLKISGLSFGHLVKLTCQGGWTQMGHGQIWLGHKASDQPYDHRWVRSWDK